MQVEWKFRLAADCWIAGSTAALERYNSPSSRPRDRRVRGYTLVSGAH